VSTDDDKIICPVSGKEIGPGEGEAVTSRKGNMWIVHRDVPADERRTDPGEGPQKIKGNPPYYGPDSVEGQLAQWFEDN
jgi:hypothetical protein